MTISFVNPGEIDMTALSVMGLSAKQTASPIGKFGTGLKYAVALTLRLGGKIKIWSGTNCYRFEAQPLNFRGKEVEQVYMSTNGGTFHPLPFTLDYGREWQAWQAMRELESNCRDEGGFSFIGTERPMDGRTTIWVDCPEIEEAYAKLSDYFITTKPLEASHKWEIHQWPGEPSTKVFFRGVYVGDFEKPSRFCYNFLRDIHLSEDRMIPAWMLATFPSKLGWIALESTNEDYLRAIITSTNHMESKPELPNGSFSFAETFHSVVESFIEDGRANLVNLPYLHYHYKATKKHDLLYTKHELTPRERRLLGYVLAVISYHYPDLPPLNIVDNLPNDTLGLYAGDKIYISKRALDMGEGTLLGTILEEYWHWKQGFTDESRTFQNFLIDRVASLMLDLHHERESKE